MDTLTQTNMAEAFLKRHRTPPLLLLPNAWDAASARLFVSAGFEMLATTSGGVAWALGYPDGEKAPWPEVAAATRRIVRAAGVPVSADIEAGYGTTPAEVGNRVSEIIQTGVVGVNIEDGMHGSLRDVSDAVARLQAAREAARKEDVPIVLNARCDIFHARRGEPSMLLAEAIDRCRSYLAAGADCVYPFGLRDAATIGEFVRAMNAPVNVTGRPGMSPIKDLERMGVARVTLASAPALIAMNAIHTLARDLRNEGGFNCLETEFHRPEAQALFSREGKQS